MPNWRTATSQTPPPRIKHIWRNSWRLTYRSGSCNVSPPIAGCKLIAVSASEPNWPHINKRRAALPSATAVSTEQSVPAAGEVVVIIWRRTEQLSVEIASELWWRAAGIGHYGGADGDHAQVPPKCLCNTIFQHCGLVGATQRGRGDSWLWAC